MPDREKVIKGLEWCTKAVRDILELNDPICTPCPYSKGHEFCCDDLKNDALALIKEQQEYIEYWSAKYDEYGEAYMKVRDERDALLKKQEPMEPITDKWRNYVCPVCGDRLRGGKFCMNCGQAVKLE